MTSETKIKYSYFTDYTFKKGLFYALAAVYVVLVLIIVIVEPFMEVCPLSQNFTSKFENPLYPDIPCRHLKRSPKLLYLTVEECSFGRCISSSVILGGIIGWERRQADRPAGIRTMALVSLGACLFTITSVFCFLNGPMSWDASRVAAAIPSGVGFLGAGLIFKNSNSSSDNNDKTTHTVRGLTTAASVWLSAAVGIACAGEMYFAATFSVAVVLLLLRFGPRQDYPGDDNNSVGESTSDHNLLFTTDPEKQPILESKKKQDPRLRKFSYIQD